MIKSITVMTIPENGIPKRVEVTTQEELDEVNPSGMSGSEFEEFYEHDLTALLVELDLNYVPVELCNEIACMNSSIPKHIQEIFVTLNKVCSEGTVRFKLDALNTLPPIVVFYLLKHGGISGVSLVKQAFKIIEPLGIDSLLDEV